MAYKKVFCKENLKAIKKNEKEILILWAEYKKITGQALAEYEKITGQALDVFFDKVREIIERDKIE
jgi:hypothetical protein